jgi:hypothetical protein
MKGCPMSQDLRPITNAFRGGRLVITFFFALFMLAMILGLVAQAFRPTSTGPDRTGHSSPRVR